MKIEASVVHFVCGMMIGVLAVSSLWVIWATFGGRQPLEVKQPVAIKVEVEDEFCLAVQNQLGEAQELELPKDIVCSLLTDFKKCILKRENDPVEMKRGNLLQTFVVKANKLCNQ